MITCWTKGRNIHTDTSVSSLHSQIRGIPPHHSSPPPPPPGPPTPPHNHHNPGYLLPCPRANGPCPESSRPSLPSLPPPPPSPAVLLLPHPAAVLLHQPETLRSPDAERQTATQTPASCVCTGCTHTVSHAEEGGGGGHNMAVLSRPMYGSGTDRQRGKPENRDVKGTGEGEGEGETQPLAARHDS